MTIFNIFPITDSSYTHMLICMQVINALYNPFRHKSSFKSFNGSQFSIFIFFIFYSFSFYELFLNKTNWLAQINPSLPNSYFIVIKIFFLFLFLFLFLFVFLVLVFSFYITKKICYFLSWSKSFFRFQVIYNSL